jgi:ribonuclease BN (tRNA processing enzyme)
MEIRFIGSGDAFGSGGRFNTCLLVTGSQCRFLIDCGASSLVALKQAGIDLNSIDGVVISHLHGDHFGGLPFLLLDARHIAKRDRPLFLFGPTGFKARLEAAQEALFPESSHNVPGFPLELRELETGARSEGRGFAVTPFLAEHSAGGTPCFSLRIKCDGRIVTYSGDTEWTERLAAAARAADLFICECSTFERPLTGHLDYKSLEPRLDAIGAKRVILTHMNPDMLERRSALARETASDGMIVTL